MYPEYRQVCPPGTISHSVQSGDTLYRIATRFNTTVAALISANPQINPNSLQIGQILCVPRQPIYPACPDGEHYTIQAGDTLYAIARSHNLSLDDLIKANPGLNPYMIMVGHVICIPVPAPPVTCPEGTPYTIVSGDSFYRIARSKNVSLDALLEANPGLDPDKLVIGRTICIPATTPPAACPPNSVSYVIKAGDNFFRLANRFNTTLAELRRLNPNVNPRTLSIGQIICVPKDALPATRQIPVTINGETENRQAVLQKSPQNYYIYVLDNYKFTPEEPGKDQLYSTLNDNFFVRIEKLTSDASISELKENALTELRDIGTPIEISDNAIAIPFFRSAEFFLYATSPAITKNIVVMKVDGGLFRFNMHLPSTEATGQIVPAFYAMLQTIGIE